MNAQDVILDALPALNSASTADLTFWSLDELYGYCTRAIARMARTAAMFTNAETATLASTSAPIDSPSGSLGTAAIAVSGRTLRRVTVADIEALGTIAATSPQRWTEDPGLSKTTLYPQNLGGPWTLNRIYHASPGGVTALSSTVPAAVPGAFAPYLFWSLLAEARAKEGDSQLPDVAAHAAARVAELEAAAKAYYGGTPV